MRGRAVVIALALVAVAIAVAASRDDEPSRAVRKAAGPPADAVRVSFVYSPEKERLIKPLVERFNAERRTSGGRRVFVEGRVMASGEAETRIAHGRLRPVAWSPASSLWGRLLDFEADRPLAPPENPSIVRTPLVIAMWEPMARALGWPRKRIGFAELLRLARSDAGWAAYGRPEFGPFKLVHTNPDFSTSGLSAVVAEYYAATGKREGLTERDVTASRARRTVRDLERSIVHYGDTTLFVADRLREDGPGYASAVAMEEVTLVDFNLRRGERDRLVAVYPREGTFFSDNPFIVLDAQWVRPEQARAARVFQRFMAERITPKLAARFGFRPASGQPPPPPLTVQNGVDPTQPERALGLPKPRVLAAIRRSWRQDRKPANIMLVVDTSASMSESDRLPRAKAGVRAFLRQLQPQDSVGLTAFSDEVRPLAPVRSGRSPVRSIARMVDGLAPYGGTALYDATAAALRDVEALGDRDRINAVVVLSDGEDLDSSLQGSELIGRLERRRESPHRVRVFTIAYSAGAVGARETLEQIAKASGGAAYVGDADDIESVYRSISSFF